MLLVHFPPVPSKGVKQLICSHCLLTRLQVVENSLDAERNRFKIIYVSRHLINCSSEGSVDKQRLEERVEIASCPLIDQTIEPILGSFGSLSLICAGRYCLAEWCSIASNGLSIKVNLRTYLYLD